MSDKFKVGDTVEWNSEAGKIHGKIVKFHSAEVEFMGKNTHASADEPQYEVESDKTGRRAMHKGSALKHLGH